VSEPVRPEDYEPPETLDAAPNQTRAKIITGAVVGIAILVCGSIAGVRFMASSSQRAQAASVATPAPGAPQPAGDVYNTQPAVTPFPTQTVPSGVPSFPLSQRQADAAANAAAAQRLQEEQEREQAARAAAILQRQQALAAQAASVPAINSQGQAPTVALAPQEPPNGEIAIPPPPGERRRAAALGDVHADETQNVGTQSAPQPTAAAHNLQTLSADQREEFIARADRETGVGYVPQVSRDQLLPTTVINARLITAIDSDLPGPASAMVTQPVYDSTTHSRVVIPQGTFLYGTYDSHIVSGQNRLLIAWTEIVFPDGGDFRMGAQPGTDAQGRSGFSGSVNNHYGDVFRAAFLLTVLGAGESLLAPPPQSVLQQPGVGQVAAQSAGGQLAQVGNQIVTQKVQRPPTITIDPPYPFQVFITRPLPLEAYRV
jgi:type IV secretory pathway VirB10-like protein